MRGCSIHFRMLNSSLSLFSRLQFSLCLIRKQLKPEEIAIHLLQTKLPLAETSWAAKFCYKQRGHTTGLVVLRFFVHPVAVGKHRGHRLLHHQDLPETFYTALCSLSFTQPGYTTNNTLPFLEAFCLTSL